MKNTSFKPLLAFIVALFVIATGDVRALPQDGKVESGRGDLSNPAHIIQNSPHLRTSWHSFDIGTSEVVNISQPSAASSIVIGVRNGLGTNINGALNANGHVTLENPAGIQFGKSSVVNVGGLLATTDQGALSSLGQINAATKVHLQNLGGNIVNVGGAVSAQKIIVESNGDVVIGGTADLSAGEVLIGGDYQGKGAIANARTTRVEAGASIDAGVKGRVIVWSDDNTYFGGRLNAPEGFAEISGKRKLQTASNFFSSVNVGTLLLDPRDIVIRAALGSGQTKHTLAADVSDSDGGATDDYIILTADLAAYTGGNLVLSATRDITISDALNIGDGATSVFSLTLNAGRNVAVNADIEVLKTGGVIIINAPGGTITVNANIDVGAGGTLTLSTRAASDANPGIVAAGSIVFGTTAPVELTAALVSLETSIDSATGGVRGTHPTTLNALGGEHGIIGVQGNLLFADLNITSLGGLQLNSLGDGSATYTSTLDASGEMRVNLGDPNTAGTGGVLSTSTSTGGTHNHDLSFIAGGNLLWEQGGIENQLGSVSLISSAYILLSTKGRSVLKGKGVTIDSDLSRTLNVTRDGLYGVWVENTDAEGFLFLGSVIDSVDPVTLSSAGHIRFRPKEDVFVRGKGVAYKVQKETPKDAPKLEASLSLLGSTLGINVTGYLEVATGEGLTHAILLSVPRGGMIFNAVPTVRANRIELHVRNDFTDLDNSPANFSVPPRIFVGAARRASAVFWQAGVLRRKTAEGTNLTLTTADITGAGYAIIEGVLDLGTGRLILEAGTSGNNAIILPSAVTTIRAGSITTIGYFAGVGALALGSTGALSVTTNAFSSPNIALTGTDVTLSGNFTATGGNLTVRGTDVTLSGAFTATSGNLTVTASGKLLFGNGTNFIQSANNISLTSATAPTAADVAVITSGTTTIQAIGGTLTLNAKINVGTAGGLIITTRTNREGAPSVIADGAIVFGTTAPVELTAKELRLHTSFTGGKRGTHPTTLTAAGVPAVAAVAAVEADAAANPPVEAVAAVAAVASTEAEALIEVQGNFLFADLNLTSSGGFKVANLGDGEANHTTTLDASGEMRINIIDPSTSTGGVFAIAQSTGGSVTHNLSLVTGGDLFWEKGGFENHIGSISLSSGAAIAISTEGLSVLKPTFRGNLVIESAVAVLDAAHRGAHGIFLESRTATGFVSLGAPIDTTSYVRIRSEGHIRFVGQAGIIRGSRIDYDVLKDDATTPRFAGTLTLTAVVSNMDISGYLPLAIGETTVSNLVLRASEGSIVFGAFTDADNSVTQTTVTADSILLEVKNDFPSLAPADFNVAPRIIVGGVSGASRVPWQAGLIDRRTAEGTDITLTAADITVAGFIIVNGVLDLGTGRLVLEAGTTGANRITLPASVREIRAASITLIGSIRASNGLAFTSAGTLSWVSSISLIDGSIALAGTDITLGGTLQTTRGDFTVTASGKLLFANGSNTIRADNVFVTSATAPTAADTAGILSNNIITIGAYGGTITLNAKINVGAGRLTITTHAALGEDAPNVVSAGAIVFGTTDPVELTASRLSLRTSSTGGAVGTETTTLTAVGGIASFIEVQGRFNFADVDITSSGGFKVANVGDAAGDVTSYETRLDASGEMRINLGDSTDVATGGVLASSTSTGGTLVHNLVFFATGDFYWDKGGIDNQLGRVSFFSRAYASISVEGDTVIKGKGVTTNSALRPLDAARRGVHAIWVENTDAESFIFSGAVLDTVGDITIKSAHHIRFRPRVNVFIRGRNVTYEAQKEIPRTFRLLTAQIVLFAIEGNVNVTGYLEATTNEANLRHRVIIRAKQGSIIFGDFTDGELTQTELIGNSIILDVKNEFTALDTAPAEFSVAPSITLDGVSGASGVSWQAGVFGRGTAQGTDITLTARDFTRAGYTINNGVLNLGTDRLILRAGTTGADKIVLPAGVTGIRAGSITLIGSITRAVDLTLTSAAALSWVSGSSVIDANLTLAGTNITLGGEFTIGKDVTVTARGKLLFGNGDNNLRGSNVSLTSATAPTAADVAVITAGTTTISAGGETITLNAKINVGTAGNLTIHMRAADIETAPGIVSKGTIIFGTTAEVELTAKELRLHASSTSGARGGEKTTLTAAGILTVAAVAAVAADATANPPVEAVAAVAAVTGTEGEAFIEVQGRFSFADVDITSTGGFKVANLRDADADTTAYTSELNASGVIRINLGDSTDVATGAVLTSSTSTGGTLTHDLVFRATGDLYWDKGGIDNQLGRVSFFSRAYASISVEGDTVIKGKGVTTNSALRPLDAARRGVHAIWVENTDAESFIFSGAVLDTVGDITIKSAHHIRFRPNVNVFIRGRNVTYEARKEIPRTFRLLRAQIVLFALTGNVSVTGYLEATTNVANLRHRVILRAKQGSIIFGDFTDGELTQTELIGNSIILDVRNEFTDLDTAPALFSVAPNIDLDGVNGASAASWQEDGVFARGTAEGVNLTLTEADFTDAGYTIDNGVLDLGTDRLVLRAGASGFDTITLPASVTSIMSSSVIIVGTILAETDLTFTSTGDLSFTGNLWLGGNVILEGTDITFGGALSAFSDITITATGKLLFANGTNFITAANVSLTSATAPKAEDVAVITGGGTAITATGGTITLNAKINLGTAGELVFSTRGSDLDGSVDPDAPPPPSVNDDGTEIPNPSSPSVLTAEVISTPVPAGAIVFGTTAPVELTAGVLRFHTSSTGGTRGTHPTTLNAIGGDATLIEVYKSLLSDEITVTGSDSGEVSFTLSALRESLGDDQFIIALGRLLQIFYSDGSSFEGTPFFSGSGSIKKSDLNALRGAISSLDIDLINDVDGGGLTFTQTSPTTTLTRTVLSPASDAFIEVQGNLLFADVNITSTGGIKAADVGDITATVTDYTTTLDASGEMRINLGDPLPAGGGDAEAVADAYTAALVAANAALQASGDRDAYAKALVKALADSVAFVEDAAGSGVLASSTSTGGTLPHELAFIAAGDLFWEKGGIDNQLGRVRLDSAAYTSISIEGASLLKGKGVTINGVLRPLDAPRLGAHAIRVENTDADSFFLLGAVIDTTGPVMIKSAGHIRFLAATNVFIRGDSISYDVPKETPSGVSKLDATLRLVAIDGDITVTGYLEVATGTDLTHAINLRAREGVIVFGDFTDAANAVTQTTVTANTIQLEAKSNFSEFGGAPAAFSVLPSITINGNATDVPWKEGLIMRTAEGTNLTLTEADITTARYAIVGGVLDLGADSFILEAGTSGTNTITLPDSIREIRAGAITIVGSIVRATNNLTLTTVGFLSLTGTLETTAGNIILNGGVTTIDGTLTASGDITLTSAATTIDGDLTAGGDITLTNATTSSVTTTIGGTLLADGDVTLEGGNITLESTLVVAVGDLTVTATGKLLFGNGDRQISGDNIFLTSAIAPTAHDVAVITGGTTEIDASGGTITLNAKINLGAAGVLNITTRAADGERVPSIIADGVIVFGTTAPVELTAHILRLHTSSTGGTRGTHPTTLTAIGVAAVAANADAFPPVVAVIGTIANAFIEVQGELLFADLNITSSGGFRVADVGAATTEVPNYRSRLDASGEIRVNLGNPADVTTGDVLTFSTSAGGTLLHNLVFRASGDLVWEKGGISSLLGRVTLISRAFTSISTQGDSVIKGKGVTINGALRPLDAARRGAHSIWLENKSAESFLLLSAVLDTTGPVMIKSEGHIRFRPATNVFARGGSVTYDVQKETPPDVSKLEASLTLFALAGDVNITGYLEVATGADLTHAITLRAQQGGIIFGAFTDADNTEVTQTKVTGNTITLDVKNDFTDLDTAPADFSVLPRITLGGVDGASAVLWQASLIRRTAEGTNITLTEADIIAAGYTIVDGVVDLGTDSLVLEAGTSGFDTITLPASVTSIRSSSITLIGTIEAEAALTFTSAGDLSFTGNLLLGGNVTLAGADITIEGDLSAFGDVTIAATGKLLFANGTNGISADNVSLTSAIAPTEADVAGITGGTTYISAFGGTITLNAKINVGTKGELVFSTRGEDLSDAPDPDPYPPGVHKDGTEVPNPAIPSVLTSETPPARVSAGAIVFGTTAPVELTARVLRFHTSLDSATGGVRGTHPTTLNADGSAALIEIYKNIIGDEITVTGGDRQASFTLSALRESLGDDEFIVALGKLFQIFYSDGSSFDGTPFFSGSATIHRDDLIALSTTHTTPNDIAAVDNILLNGINTLGIDLRDGFVGTLRTLTWTAPTTTSTQTVTSPASDAFIEVQGNLLFANVNITSSGGIKAADVGDATATVTDYTSRLDASGEMRINLGNHADVATGGVLASSTSTGGTLAHELAFFAAGDLFWEQGGINNQLGSVSLASDAYTSLSTEGDSVLKGKGVTINGTLSPLDADHLGAHPVWLENTDADSFIFSGAVIDTTGDVTIKSEGHIRFLPAKNAFIRGGSIAYEVQKETPGSVAKLAARIVLFAIDGDISITGYLEATTDDAADLDHRVVLRAQQGRIIFRPFVDAANAVTQTTVTGNAIILDVGDDFIAIDAAPAAFSVVPEITLGGVSLASAVLWQEGVLARRTLEGAGGITLTAADITAAGYTIDANGVLDLGTDNLLLEAGTSGLDKIVLPASVTSIMSSFVTIIGTIEAETDLTFISSGSLSFTSNLGVNSNVTLEGTDITFGGDLAAFGDVTITATGKLLFANGDNFITADNVSLTSATAPTAADVAVITKGGVAVSALGGTITLNAKIDVGTAGELVFSTRGDDLSSQSFDPDAPPPDPNDPLPVSIEELPKPISAGAIVFGTTAPVELTAGVLRLHTSSTGGVRGTHPTTLNAIGRDATLIEVYGTLISDEIILRGMTSGEVSVSLSALREFLGDDQFTIVLGRILTLTTTGYPVHAPSPAIHGKESAIISAALKSFGVNLDDLVGGTHFILAVGSPTTTLTRTVLSPASDAFIEVQGNLLFADVNITSTGGIKAADVGDITATVTDYTTMLDASGEMRINLGDPLPAAADAEAVADAYTAALAAADAAFQASERRDSDKDVYAKALAKALADSVAFVEDAAGSGVLASSTSTGGTLPHELAFIAAGDLFWEKGGIDNQLGRVRLDSAAYTSISTEGASLLKGKGVTINGVLRPLDAPRLGAHAIRVENTDADSFFLLGAVIDTTGPVMIKSAGHIRFLAATNVFIRGDSISYDVPKETPSGVSKLDATLRLVAIDGDINVTGYLEVATGTDLTHAINLRAREGVIVFGDFTDAANAVTQTTVTANAIQLEAKDNFSEFGGAPAAFSVLPSITIAGTATDVPWKEGLIMRTAEGTDLTLTEADITTARYAIVGGVLDLGTDSFILEAGTSGTNTITLPDSIREIRAGAITIVGSIVRATNNLTLTTIGFLSLTGTLETTAGNIILNGGATTIDGTLTASGDITLTSAVTAIDGTLTAGGDITLTNATTAVTTTTIGGTLSAGGDVTLEGGNITLGGTLQASDDFTVTATGKLLFANGSNLIRGATISLTSAIAPTAHDVASIVAGDETFIQALGGTITLNAKINVGTAGTLRFTTRASGEASRGVLADGAIVFGTTAPVELTANVLLLHTSSTGGARGTHPTTLTTIGVAAVAADADAFPPVVAVIDTIAKAFIEVQGRLLFADVNITSSGGFKVANLGDASGDVTSYETRLDASGEIRINLGAPTDVATGGVLASSTSTGGTLVHNLVFFATGDFYWDKGGIDNQLGRVSFFSRAYASISVEGDTVIKGKGVTTNSALRPLDAARRGVHAIWVENTDAESFIFSGAVLDTVGDITIKSAHHIRFRPNVNVFIRGRNVTYEARKEIPRTFRLLRAQIVLFALAGNVSVTGYLEATTNVANLRHRVIIRAQQGSITFGDFTDGTLTQTELIGNSIILDVKNDFTDLDTAPAEFSVAPLITIAGSASGASWQAGLAGNTAEGVLGGITLTEEDITDAGHAIVGGVLDLGTGSLSLRAGTSGSDTITLPDSLTEIRAGSIFIIGTIAVANDLTLTSASSITISGTITAANDLTLTSAGSMTIIGTITTVNDLALTSAATLSVTGTLSATATATATVPAGKITLAGTDIILRGNLSSNGDFTVEASGKILFGNGENAIQGTTVSLTSAIAPTRADVAVTVAGDATTITAPGGTITLNAKINVGARGRLVFSTRASGEVAPSVIADGAIVFGTTAPVELTARELFLHTSLDAAATDAVRGTHPTTLTAADATGGGKLAFIEVQGRLNFADVNITSTSGFKVADVGAADADTTSYETRLDASGEMRINLGDSTNAATGGVLAASTSTGGTLTHDLVFFATGDLYWDKGGINNQLGRVSFFSRAYASISVEGDTVIKGKGVTTNSALRPLDAARRGVHAIWLENTDAESFIFSGAVLDTVGDITIKSANHIRFRPRVNVFIRGRNVTYEARKEIPRTFRLLTAQIVLFAIEGNVSVTGYLEATTNVENLRHRVIIRAQQGSITFGDFTDGTLTQTTLIGNSIILDVKDDFTDLNTAPAEFSVSPDIDLGGVSGASAALWQAGVFGFRTAEGAGGLTLEATDFTDAGHAIDADGVLDLGANSLVLAAGTTGADTITLPTSITEIRAGVITIVGSIQRAATALTLTSATTLSVTGFLNAGNTTLAGTDITLSGNLSSTSDFTVTARGKLLFGNGDNFIRAVNVSLTSAIAPTVEDVAVITAGTTSIAAPGVDSTITLNAKINVGTAGALTITTRTADVDGLPGIVATGAIVFGTTAPVELTAKELRLHTSLTGGARGGEKTTLTAAGVLAVAADATASPPVVAVAGTETDAFIEVQGRFNFADVDITSSGGFKVANVGDAAGEVTSYETRLDASGEMRINLGDSTDVATGGVLASSTSTGGTLVHNLVFFATGDFYWDKGGIDNQLGRVSFFSRAYASISVVGDTVIKGKGVTTNSALRPLDAARRGVHAIWLENTDVDSFIFSGAVLDTVGDITIKSAHHIRFRPNVNVFIRGRNVTYEARKEIPRTFRLLRAQIVLFALTGNVNVTGYLEATTNEANLRHRVTIRAQQGRITFGAFTDGVVTKTTVIGNSIILDVKDDFQTATAATAPATFSVAPDITVSSAANGGTAQPWLVATP